MNLKLHNLTYTTGERLVTQMDPTGVDRHRNVDVLMGIDTDDRPADLRPWR